MRLIFAIFSVIAGVFYYYYSSHTATPAPVFEQGSKMMRTGASGRLPVYFFSHGGPTFMYSDQGNVMGGDLGAFNSTKEIGKYVKETLKPEFVLCVSAHWQTDRPGEVQIAVPKGEKAENELIYDFYGFPRHMYQEQFHTVGSTSLAQKVVAQLKDNGFNASAVRRGIDHGVWVPFKVAFAKNTPEGQYWDLDCPLLQISLPGSDSFEENFNLGKALEPFRQNGLIIVSGMSVHNLRDHMMGSFTGYTKPFNTKLTEALKSEDRLTSLLELQNKQNIQLLRHAHPTLEHFLPVVVGAGSAQSDSVKEIYSSASGALGWNIYRFGDAPKSSL
jgi:4,5-DOPA dioxygenase extradiol